MPTCMGRIMIPVNASALMVCGCRRWLRFLAIGSSLSFLGALAPFATAAGAFSVTYPQTTYHFDTVTGLQRQDPTLHNATPGKATIFGLSGGGIPENMNGMGIDASGVLVGLPTLTGNYTLVETASNDGRSASTVLNLVIEDGNPLTLFYPLPTLVVGDDIGVVQPIVRHETPGYVTTFSLASGALPAGLSLSSDGSLSGTPTTAGAYSFSI